MRCAQLRCVGRNASRFRGSDLITETLSSSAVVAPHRYPCHVIDSGHVEAVMLHFGRNFAFQTESQDVALDGRYQQVWL